MVKWYDETYLTRERHACVIKGVGVIAIERVIGVNHNWLLRETSVMGPLCLNTSHIEDAKRKALGQIHEVVSDMMRAMDEAITDIT